MMTKRLSQFLIGTFLTMLNLNCYSEDKEGQPQSSDFFFDRYQRSHAGFSACSFFPLEEFSNSQSPSAGLSNECLDSEFFRFIPQEKTLAKKSCLVSSYLGDFVRPEYLIVHDGASGEILNFYAANQRNNAIFTVYGYPVGTYYVPENSSFGVQEQGAQIQILWSEHKIQFTSSPKKYFEPFELQFMPPIFSGPVSMVLQKPISGFLNFFFAAQIFGIPGPDFSIYNSQKMLIGRYSVSQNTLIQSGIGGFSYQQGASKYLTLNDGLSGFSPRNFAKIEGDCHPLLKGYLMLMYLQLVPTIFPSL